LLFPSFSLPPPSLSLSLSLSLPLSLSPGEPSALCPIHGTTHLPARLVLAPPRIIN
jgi:hypothetical protein